MKFYKEPKFKIGDKVKTIRNHKVYLPGHDSELGIWREGTQQFGFKKGLTGVIDGYAVLGDAFTENYWVKSGDLIIQVEGEHLIIK